MNTRHLTLLFLITTSVFLRAAENDAPAAKPKPPPQKPAATGMYAMFLKHWQDRVSTFKEQNKTLTPGNVVLLGDSITEGFDVTKHFPGRQIINRGIGADTIGNALPSGDFRGVLQRLDNSVFDCKATDVFILIGINDTSYNHSVETMEAGYREMLGRIRKQLPKLRIHVQSVLPTSGKFENRNESVRQFNARLKKLAEEFSCSFIDLHPLMCDAEGKLNAEFTKDGLHLLEPGYLVWREQVLKAMNW